MVDMDEAVTIGMRVENAVLMDAIRECNLCGNDVGISQETVEAIERGAYPETIWCLKCANEEAK